jgi:parallel beta-helix repeat protein
MFGLALISLWGLPRPLGAAVVDKTGTISLDETWSTGNIYRITGDVTIVGGVKLTIQPGAIVKFNASTRIYVNTGAIKATGTSDNPIIFTSYRDDSAGGDTNGDGPSRGSPGDWNMVYFENPNGTFTDFRYCIFRYGGSGNSSAFNVYGDTQGLFTIADSVFSDNKSYGIYFYNAAHTIRNNTFERNTSHGIYLQSGTKSPLVEGNIIRNNSACGLYVEGMTPTIRNNQMLNNADWGLYFTSAVYPPVITGNTITGNLRPAIIPANALPNDSDGNTFAPNTINALWIRSNDLNHSVTLSIKHPGETYEINTYIFYDTLNINGTNKLTVNPGVIVKFADGASVSVNGTLNAIGTASQPIVFTSYRDDLHGGDINADGIATMPYNGAWAGLRFYDTSNDSDCKLSYAIVMYGGSSTANIYIENANPTIDHSTIAASLYDGINLYYSNPVITNSEIWGNFRHGINSYYGKPNVSTTMIYGNTYSGIYLEGLPSDYTIQNNEIFANQDYGINNKTTRICTATNTWWGATNGPSGVGSGSGDRISSNVTYAPIATSGSGFSYLNAGPNTKRGTLPLPTIIQGTSSSEWGSVVNTDVLWDLDKVVLRYAGLPTDKRYQLNLSYINGDNTTGVGGNIQSLWDGYGNFIHSRLKIPSTPGAFYYGLPPKSYNNSSAPGNLELNFVRENGYRATVAEVLIVEKGNIPNTIPPVSAITLPADNAHLRGSLYTMTGTCSDPNSDPIATVEIGIERAGSITWYAVTELKTSGNWKYRWGLPADGIYKLYSRATDIYGNREEPTSFVSVEVDNNPPEKPTNLAIYDYPADTGSKIQVTWRISADDSAADNDVVNYRIERRSNTTDDFSLIATVAAGVTSYEDSPTTDGTTYYYRIVAVDDAGNYGYSDIYGPVISIDNSSDSIAPKPITNLTGRAGNTFVTLGWTKSVDSDKDIYDQLLSVSDNGGTSWGSEISLGKETFYYLVSGLTNGVPYLFRIRTKDTAGNFSTWVQTGPHTPATTAYTAVSSDICPGGEVHWLAGVFWVRADIQICAGTTLYIHEGVIVKFGLNSGPYGRLTVRGALNAVGTAEKPIIFTSRFDDSAGGDTNGDGSTTTPAAGDWQNLYFESSNPLANCILNYVKIRYAGHDTYASGAIQTSYAAFPVTNSEIVNNKTDGINIYYSSMTIRNNLINNNKGHTNYGRGIYNSGTFTATISGNTISNHVHGIYLDGDARPTIINNTIQNNSSYGVYFSSNYTAPAMSGNIITGNNIALCVPLSALPREESGNSFSGNQKKYLQVRGNDLAATLELRIWHKGTADEIKTYWFVSSDAHVVTGAYLKIHPGVITKWASGIRLYVEGAMRAEGTSSEKIYFTSYRDDSVGGDTNGDGYTRGYPGDWYGLSFVDTVIDFLTLLDYSVVSYAGQSTAGIYTENTAFKITHSLITSNANHGIYQYYSNTLYQNNQILANNKNGIYTYGSGSPTIDGNIIAQNGESGIYVESNTYTTIRNNTINANAQWGIYFTSNPSVPVITGNTITNNLRSMILPAASMPNDSDGNTLAPNQINAIWLRGTDLYRNLELNIKYPSTSQEINTYVIYSTLTIRDSYTLTVRPGVIVKFDDNSGITVYGALNSQGTATQRIVYTSYRDDAYGGDLNLDGYGSGPYNGIWSGIRFYDSSIDNQCLFNYSILKYGGGSTALIYAENASPTFQNSVIAASSNDGINLYYSSIQLINCEIWGNTKSGIYTYYASPTVTGSRIFANYVDGILLEGNGSPTITNNEIFGNDGYGVRNNYTSKTINVTNIWWGAANGPSGVASGSGDQVSSALNYASYKTSGSNFVYFDAGPNRSEGTLPAMSVTSGIYSAEWGSTPGTNVLYDVDKVVLQATNLNPSTLYEIFLTYYNHDNTSGIGGNIQSLTDASNTIIHRSLSVPFSTPSPFFYSLPANTYGSGNLTLNFNRLNGYRACVSEVWVIEKGNVSDTTAPVVTITKPLNNAHINGSVYTVSGTATDGSGSGVMLVELGIDKGTGISWRAATELKNDGNWSYRWNLPSDGYYSLYVRGTDYVGNTGNPGTAVLVYINNTAPAVPTNVSAWDTPNDSGGSISLSWKKSTDDGAGIDDVVGYEIMRRQGTSGEFGLIGTVNKGAQAYVDATTTDQTDYYYQIVAVDKAGNRGTSTTYGPVKSIKNDGSDTTAPEDVTNLKGIPGNQFIFIYWTTSANSQKDLYDQLVSLSTDGGTSWGSDISIGKEATYYLIEGLLNNTAYKVRVRMKDSSGNISTGAQTGPHTPSTTAHTAVTADLCSGGDVHWLAGVYWIKADIQICSGTTLYIHEGVIVKFGLNSGPYGRLTVRGALNAVGTVEKPIIFTSRFDDSAGGDTNGDGSTTTPAAGDWQNLYFESSNPLSKCALDYVKIRYAGHDTYASGAIQTSYAAFPVTNSEIVNNKTDGINIYYSSMTISNNLISNNKGHTNYGRGIYNSGTFTATISGNTISNQVHGIYLDGDSRPTIINNMIQNNSGYGVYFSGNYAAPALSGNSITGNNIAVCIPISALPRDEVGNSFAGNQKKYIQLRGNDVPGTIELRVWHKGTSDEISLYWLVSSDIRVITGAFLKIHPKVKIKMGSGLRLSVEGALNAKGTVDEPIIFTSYRDDELVGDTNGDGFTRGAAGDWSQISFYSTVVTFLTQLDYVEVRYGGASSGGIYVEQTTFPISNCLIQDSRYDGINYYYSSAALTSNTIRNNGRSGIYLYGSSAPAISGNTIEGNIEGIYVEGGGTPNMKNNLIRNNRGWGIYYTSSSATPVIKNNTITGNTRPFIIPAAAFPNDSDGNVLAPNNINALWIRGNDVYRNLTFNIKYPTESYRIDTYVIFNTMQMTAGYRLTVDPAVTLKFADGAELTIRGSLRAEGTATEKVVFTSYADDSNGGDTNADGNGTTPRAGDWNSIRFYDPADDANCVIRHAIINYGGRSTAGIYAENTNVTLSDSLIANSQNAGINMYASNMAISNTTFYANAGYGGIYTYSSSPTFTGCRFFANFGDGLRIDSSSTPSITNSEIFANFGYGINNTSASTINASNNWWGSPTGPTISTNPGGTGDKITTKVTYSSFKSTGTEFFFYDAGASTHYGYLIGQPSMANGLASTQWGSAPQQSFLYNIDNQSIRLDFSGLSTAGPYTAYVLYMNQDSGSSWQTLTDASGNFLQRKMYIPYYPTAFEYPISSASLTGGYLSFNFNWLSGFRTVFSGVLLLKAGSQDTNIPNVVLTYPASGMTLPSLVHTITGKATDSSSAIATVEIGFRVNSGSWNWYTVSTLTDNGDFAYRWSNPGSGRYEISARAYDRAGNVGYAATTVNVIIDGNYPQPATDVYAEDRHNSDPGVLVMWVKSLDDGYGDNDVVKYEVYRYTEAVRNASLLGSTTKGVETFIDATAQNGTKYFYFIRTYDLAGNASDSSVYGPVTPVAGGTDTTAPENITGLTATPKWQCNGLSSVYLKWTDSINSEKDMADHRLYISSNGGASWTGPTSMGRFLTDYEVMNLTGGVTYTIKITVVDEVPNESSGTSVTVKPLG